METRFLHQCGLVDSVSFVESTKDLSYIEERVNQIETHIRQLQELKNALRRRSNHIRSPLYAVPVEVVSRIFLHATHDPDLYREWEPEEVSPNWKQKRICLRQILSLTSVSFHLRQVALRTPELWNRMSLEFDALKLARCISYARISSLFCAESPATLATVEDIDPITTALASDLMLRVKVLRLQMSSAYARGGWYGSVKVDQWDPPDWEPISSCFPALTTLNISVESHSKLLLHTIPLSRLEIDAPNIEQISLPASLKVLCLRRIPNNISTSILLQCPNLIECVNVTTSNRPSTFTRPLTLDNLERLTWPLYQGFQDVASVQNINLPALKFLTVVGCPEAEPTGILKLCNQVSATVISLSLKHGAQGGWKPSDFIQLLRVPFSHLETISIYVYSLDMVLQVLSAISESQYSNYVPSLKTLNIRGWYEDSDTNFSPATLLDLLGELKLRGPICLHLDIPLVESDWSFDLRRQLKLIMSDDRVRITYKGRGIQWLDCER